MKQVLDSGDYGIVQPDENSDPFYSKRYYRYQYYDTEFIKWYGEMLVDDIFGASNQYYNAHKDDPDYEYGYLTRAGIRQKLEMLGY